MGNRVSTGRKLAHNVGKEQTLNRSKINQLPSESMKERFLKQDHPSSQQPQVDKKDEANDDEILGKKDGGDPQEQDMIQAFSNLGRLLDADAQKEKMKKFNPNSLAVNQLKNRETLYKMGQENKETKNLKLVDPQKLTAVLNDFHDQKYSNERVKEDFDLDDAFLAGLSRFKVANTYKKIQDTTSKDEIGHQGAKIDDNVQQRADTSPKSDKDLNSLKLRISVDD